MSNSTSFPEYESRSWPDSSPFLEGERSHPRYNKLPSIPVYSYLSVPSPLAPSVLSISPSERAAPPPPSPPSAPHSDSGSEDFGTFEDHEEPPYSTVSPSLGIHKNPFDVEFGRACGVSGDSNFSTDPASWHDPSQQIPVSLPIDSPQWMEILTKLSDNADGEAIERFARMVMSHSMRVRYLKDIEALREHNRVANMRDEPLTPLPNFSGHAMPPGYNHAITSISQISDMALEELDSWLSHYDLAFAQHSPAEHTKRLVLASHVGVDALDDPNIPVDGPKSG